MINGLLCELSKYKHYSKLEMENYYFRKRLSTFIPIYINFIKTTIHSIEKTSSSFTTFKEINNKAKLVKKKK